MVYDSLQGSTMTDPVAIEESDPLLAHYLRSKSDTESATLLGALFAQHATPVIEQILRGKQPQSEIADVASATREQLLRQLAGLRSGQRTEPIRNFPNYVASATYSAWAEFLRSRQPQRSQLLNRLRYLLENRTSQKGFALWEDDRGERWCGFVNWRGQTGAATPRRQWLTTDPLPAAREALRGLDPVAVILPELLSKLFRWLNGPIELGELTTILCELLGYSKTQTPVDENVVYLDPRHSPAEELVWKEYLTWLWNEIGTLSERQRRAFLLHLDILREFELLGIASIRMIARALSFAPDELATIWNQLPLDDLTIARMLDSTRQQVINLRRVARDKLGNAWKEWSAGNKSGESPSELRKP